MWIKKIELENIKCFKKAELNLSRGINLIAGNNNSGKSTILRPILCLQENSDSFASLLSLGEEKAKARIELADTNNPNGILVEFSVGGGCSRQEYLDASSRKSSYKPFPAKRPNNFIFPFLSNRKTKSLTHNVNAESVNTISLDFSNLNAQIDNMISRHHSPAGRFYVMKCAEALGLERQPPIMTTAIADGKHAVLITKLSNINIPLAEMGSGCFHVLSLIGDLADANNKLFIIEEPENDIHPKALKVLLDAIIERADNNQFIISTHSNIVIRKLGAYDGTKVFKVEQKFDENDIPLSNLSEINTSEERQQLLEDLGYDFHDLGLYQGWVIFEESSAEIIVRDFLIHWFTPKLKSVIHTLSSKGVTNITKRLDNLNDLFVFIHLTEVYKNKAWIIVDAGDDEKKILDDLKGKYSAWNQDNFIQLEKHDFEEYYPKRFEAIVRETLNIQDKREKRQAKNDLLAKIVKWCKDSDAEAKTEFEESAKEIITILKQIEITLLS